MNFDDSTEISMNMMKREVGGNRRRRAETTLPQSVEQRQHPPFIIISYLNTLHIRQKTSSESNINLNATIRIQQGRFILTSFHSSLDFILVGQYFIIFGTIFYYIWNL